MNFSHVKNWTQLHRRCYCLRRRCYCSLTPTKNKNRKYTTQQQYQKHKILLKNFLTKDEQKVEHKTKKTEVFFFFFKYFFFIMID